MVKVIVRGTAHLKTCGKCLSKLEITPQDYQGGNWIPNYGYEPQDETIYHKTIQCPVCNAPISLSTYDIPKENDYD